MEFMPRVEWDLGRFQPRPIAGLQLTVPSSLSTPISVEFATPDSLQLPSAARDDIVRSATVNLAAGILLKDETAALYSMTTAWVTLKGAFAPPPSACTVRCEMLEDNDLLVTEEWSDPSYDPDAVPAEWVSMRCRCVLWGLTYLDHTDLVSVASGW